MSIDKKLKKGSGQQNVPPQSWRQDGHKWSTAKTSDPEEATKVLTNPLCNTLVCKPSTDAASQ